MTARDARARTKAVAFNTKETQCWMNCEIA